jgi:1-aminocyclopropane-1-carboxylate deaminase
VIQILSTPVREISDEFLKQAELKLFVKREDLNHPTISGNKSWKLKYNLEEAVRRTHHTVLTFGGAFSNHIYAVAAATGELGLKSIGIIRGEEIKELNDTLKFAVDNGMQLHFVSREAYRKKTDDTFIENLREQHGDFYLIPEGGTNELAVRGCEELGKEINKISFDYLCLPVGTGGTMAGIIRSIGEPKKVIGFSVLKGDFLKDEVEKLSGVNSHNTLWEINTDYHFGGYAKTSAALNDFIHNFKKQHSIPIEFVYTGKMMFGIYDLISRGYFKRGSTIVALHTGGLQGKY